MTSTLRSLFDEYSCDKGFKHNYELVYEKDFEKLKDLPIDILEIGVLNGDSIKVWLDYFPNATIYCIDIFERVPAEDIPVLSHSRVVWETCDSISEQPKQLWNDIKFDIIIDDGKHNSVYNRLTFENFFDKLKVGGAYYVEDVVQHNIVTSRDRLKGSWEETLSNNYYIKNGSIVDYNDMLQRFRREGKSVFIYDTREPSKRIDSCIIKITK